MTKAFKIELYFIDTNGEGYTAEDIKEILQRKPLYADVKDIEEADIGEWADDHPLNYCRADIELYRSYFGEKSWKCNKEGNPYLPRNPDGTKKRGFIG